MHNTESVDIETDLIPEDSTFIMYRLFYYVQIRFLYCTVCVAFQFILEKCDVSICLSWYLNVGEVHAVQIAKHLVDL